MANKNYALLHMEKLKRNRVKDIQLRGAHVNRQQFAENVDATKSMQNKCLVGDQTDWFELFKARYKSLEYYKQPEAKQLRKDAVVGVEIIMSMSHDMAENIDIDKWGDANVEWLKNEFGDDNVMHATLHMDESTPHIHAFVTPVKDGKFKASEVIGDRDEYIRRQTSYATAMQKFGLTRGLKRNYRMPYLSLQQLYAQTGDVHELPEVLPCESADEYRGRIEEYIAGLQIRNNAQEHEIEQLMVTNEHSRDNDDYIAELERELDEARSTQPSLNGMSIAALEKGFKYYPDRNTAEQYLNILRNFEELGLEIIKNEREEKEKSEVGI